EGRVLIRDVLTAVARTRVADPAHLGILKRDDILVFVEAEGQRLRSCEASDETIGMVRALELHGIVSDPVGTAERRLEAAADVDGMNFGVSEISNPGAVLLVLRCILIARSDEDGRK